ncbi:hypothetical protein PHYSODRAFT_348748, partial [Phytophthora sojae]
PRLLTVLCARSFATSEGPSRWARHGPRLGVRHEEGAALGFAPVGWRQQGHSRSGRTCRDRGRAGPRGPAQWWRINVWCDVTKV